MTIKMMTLKIKEIKLTVAFCIFCSFFFPQTVGKFPKSRNHDSQPLGEMICKLMVEHQSLTYRKHCIHNHLLIKGKEEHLYVFWSICSCENLVQQELWSQALISISICI